jgi:hypothetical protein
MNWEYFFGAITWIILFASFFGGVWLIIDYYSYNGKRWQMYLGIICAIVWTLSVATVAGMGWLK